jgi:hypothetical protein
MTTDETIVGRSTTGRVSTSACNHLSAHCVVITLRITIMISVYRQTVTSSAAVNRGIWSSIASVSDHSLSDIFHHILLAFWQMYEQYVSMEHKYCIFYCLCPQWLTISVSINRLTRNLLLTLPKHRNSYMDPLLYSETSLIRTMISMITLHRSTIANCHV